ncbi:hypothetical protein M885DRAFT_562073 [Pelagophyceae sp. CCMP2097]|nr:hypothetical protein M885DRAFT_562073 [Pelagophyceae sp. CCMP2097]
MQLLLCVSAALLRVALARFPGFPAGAMVRMPGGAAKTMDEVDYGDLVLVVGAGTKDRYEEGTPPELEPLRLDGSAPKALRLGPDNMLSVCAAPAGAPNFAACPLAPAHRVRPPGMAVRRLGAGGAPELAVVTAVSLETLVGSYHVHANWEIALLYVDDHVVAEFPGQGVTSANATADATHNATDVGAAFVPPGADDSNVHPTAGQRLSHVEFFSKAATGGSLTALRLVTNATLSAPLADDSIESWFNFGGRGFDIFVPFSPRDLAPSAAPTSTRAGDLAAELLLRPTPAPTFVGTAEEPFSSDADCASGSCAFAGRRALLFGYFALLVGYYANR